MGKGAFFILVAGCCWLALSGAARAERILHHGLEVESEGADKCLACHDGAVGPNITPCTNSCAVGSAASHPVARSYPPPGKEAGYRPLAEVVRAGVRLQEGKITCLSCHDLTKNWKYHLSSSRIAQAVSAACAIFASRCRCGARFSLAAAGWELFLTGGRGAC